MRIHELTATVWLRPPPEAVFPFFGEAGNLDALTPPWLGFEIATPRPIAMQPGALIDYRLKVRGLPIRWRTRIARWDPPRSFVDEQLRGPYRLWEHTHSFEPEAGGTLARDHVRYAVPLDFFGLVNWLLVRRDVEQIFRYRTQKLLERFGGEER